MRVYVSGTAKMGLLEVNDVASKNEFKVDVICLHLQLNFNYKIISFNLLFYVNEL